MVFLRIRHSFFSVTGIKIKIPAVRTVQNNAVHKLIKIFVSQRENKLVGDFCGFKIRDFFLHGRCVGQHCNYKVQTVHATFRTAFLMNVRNVAVVNQLSANSDRLCHNASHEL